MRLLHVSQPVEAGVARCVVQLASEQVRRGWSVTVACPPGWLADAVSEAGAAVRTWHASRSPGLSVLAETKSLARIVADVRPDVVHLHSAKAGLAGRLVLRGRVPTAYQPHAWSFEAVGSPLSLLVLAWERLAARWVDLLLCVSAAEHETGLRRGVRGPYALAPNGVDLRAFPRADGADRADARRELGLDGRPTAVCLGRLSRQKGQDVLIAAWPMVRRSLPDARLVLVGGGEPPPGARRDRAGITFAGRTDRAREWLVAADVVVVPSRWEGQALVVLEAMACGRSVVGSDVSGIAESLGLSHHEPGTGTGAVVPPDDPQALAREIVARLADHARAEVEGAAAAEHAARHHDLAVTLPRSLALVEGLAGPPFTEPSTRVEHRHREA